MRERMRKVSSQTSLPDELARLYNHLKSCKQCGAAFKAVDASELCYAGRWHTLKAAHGYASLFRLRRKVHSRPGGCVYACPDLTKHGEAYVLTAPALIVTGVQETLL